MHRGRDQGGDPESGRTETDDGAGDAGEGQRQTHSDRGDGPAGSGDGPLAEPVDEAIADDPADELHAGQRDEPEGGDGRAGTERTGQVQRRPGTAGVLDDRAAHRDQAERQQGRRRWPNRIGRDRTRAVAVCARRRGAARPGRVPGPGSRKR